MHLCRGRSWPIAILIQPRPQEGRASWKLLLEGGDGRPPKEGGGVLEKWVSLPGPLYCVRTDFGARTQILLPSASPPRRESTASNTHPK